MALPELDPFEAEMYQDSMDIYREVYDENSNSLGFLLVAECVPLDYHRTWNFDTNNSPAGMSKEVSLLTSNRSSSQYEVDIRSLDAAYVTTRHGDSEWGAVQGAPKKPVAPKHCAFYVVPCVPPTIFVPEGETKVWIPSVPGVPAEVPAPPEMEAFQVGS